MISKLTTKIEIAKCLLKVYYTEKVEIIVDKIVIENLLMIIVQKIMLILSKKEQIKDTIRKLRMKLHLWEIIMLCSNNKYHRLKNNHFS